MTRSASVSAKVIVTPKKRSAKSFKSKSSKKSRVNDSMAADVSSQRLTFADEHTETAKLSNIEVGSVEFGVGTRVRLNASGLDVEEGYDWSADALRPGMVGKVCGVEDGWVVVEGSDPYEQTPYDPTCLERVDVETEGQKPKSSIEARCHTNQCNTCTEGGDGIVEAPGLLLVVGECGDGKSSLINRLRDPKRSGQAASGLKSRGVTKEIKAYVGNPIAGRDVDFLDTPGVGDMDVTPMKVLSMLEQELISDDVRSADAIDGVIVTTQIPEGRVKLGAQVVQLLVEHGFVGEEKWKNVILVGTKADRATDEEKELFRTSDLDENGEALGIAAQFFAQAPDMTGTFVMTSKDDISQLQAAISKLPRMKVRYNAPDPATMADAFAERLGISKELLQEELTASREALQNELDAQFAEREAKMREDMEQMREQHLAEAKEQQRQADEQAAAMKKQMEAALEEQTRVQAQMKETSGREAEALKKHAKDLEEVFKRTQAEHDQVRRQWNAQLEEKEQSLQRLMRQLEEQQRSAQRARNYDFGTSTDVSSRGCLHPRTRNWGNAFGRGRKCVDCRVELGRQS